MFKNFFRGVASINAATYFEKVGVSWLFISFYKARLQATYTGDTCPANEKDLQSNNYYKK